MKSAIEKMVKHLKENVGRNEIEDSYSQAAINVLYFARQLLAEEQPPKAPAGDCGGLRNEVEILVEKYKDEENLIEGFIWGNEVVEDLEDSLFRHTSTPEAQKPMPHDVKVKCPHCGLVLWNDNKWGGLVIQDIEAQKPLCKIDPSFLCDELTAKPTTPVNLLELKKWVISERDRLKPLGIFESFIIALCNRIDELTVKPVKDDPMQEKCKNGGKICSTCRANRCTARRYNELQEKPTHPATVKPEHPDLVTGSMPYEPDDYALAHKVIEAEAAHRAEEPAPVKPVEEPLAVICVRKNSWIAFSGKNMGGKYRIDIETFGVKLTPESCFAFDTYQEAEQAARLWLEAREDKKEGV